MTAKKKHRAVTQKKGPGGITRIGDTRLTVDVSRPIKKVPTYPAAMIKRVAQKMLEQLIEKANAHDRALALWAGHKPETGGIDGTDLVHIVSYLVGRSNAMQETIQQVEQRERALKDRLVNAKPERPKTLEEMTREELLAHIRYQQWVNSE